MPLGIQIDEKDLFLEKIQTRREIDAGRGLPASAFLIRDRDDSQKVRLLE
jgi:hypothetical protein